MATEPGDYVFINYARADADAVRVLSRYLDESRYRTWVDTELVGGTLWWDQILEAILGCRALVYVLSPDSVQSRACLAEFEYALGLMRPILPVLVREIDPALLPRPLAEIQWVDFRTPSAESGKAVATALALLGDPRPLPDPLPSQPAVPIGPELIDVSQSVSDVRAELTGAVTASAIAAAIRSREPELDGWCHPPCWAVRWRCRPRRPVRQQTRAGTPAA